MRRMSDSSLLLVLGSFFAGSAVVAGAFGAHALKEVLDAPMLEVFDTPPATKCFMPWVFV